MKKFGLTRRDLLGKHGFLGLLAWHLISQRKLMANQATGLRRMVFVYIPAGLHASGWRIQNLGGNSSRSLVGMNFGQNLRDRGRSYLDVFDRPEYEGLKEDLLLLDGVDMRCNSDGPDGADEHHHGARSALRGYNMHDDRSGNRGTYGKTSVDIQIASNLGLESAAVLHAGIRFAVAGYMNRLSHVTEGNLASRLVTDSEQEFWDRVFGNFNPQMQMAPAPASPDRSLGLIHALHKKELQSLSAVLSADEKLKLEKHLAILEEMDRKAAVPGNATVNVPKELPVPARPGSSLNGNQDILAKYKAANKVVAAALAYNQVRVVNYFGFGQISSGVNLNGFRGDYHNSVAHNGGGGGSIRDSAYRAGSAYMEAIADLMLQLKAIPEGEGTVLDNTTICTYVDMCDGDHRHRGTPGPYFIAGGGGLSPEGRRHWKTGNYVRVSDKSSNDYLVSLAHCMGHSIDADPSLLQMQQFGRPNANTSNGSGLDNEGILG